MRSSLVALVISALLCPLLPACTSESPTRTTGTLEPFLFHHIKTYEMVLEQLDETDTEFAANHYNVFIGFPQVPYVYEVNPRILVLSYQTLRANSGDDFGPTCDDDTLCAEAWASARGCDHEDFFLHYKINVNYTMTFGSDGITRLVRVPGWDPTRPPGDPTASAESEDEARVWGIWSPEQRWANVADSCWRHWRTERVVGAMRRNGRDVDGILLDGIAAQLTTMDYIKLNKTHEYWEETIDENFTLIDDRYGYVQFLGDYFDEYFGEEKILMANAEATWYLASEAANASRLQSNFEWVLVESGVRYDPDNPGVPGCCYEANYDNLMILYNLAQSGTKILFGGVDISDSERGTLFGLATFYLMNHENMYYGRNVPTAEGLWWFDAVAYDIGPPSGEPYEWATGTDPSSPPNEFHIVARDYVHALVLVKFRNQLSLDFGESSATAHALDKFYRPLQMDGSLGDSTSVVTLRNNEAAILIPTYNVGNW